MSERSDASGREMGKRIVRSATAEEATRHADVRRRIAEEIPEIEEWAREAAAQCCSRVAVGTVFSAEERTVIEAIDAYAASHSLPNRSAVIREALARLLNMSIPAKSEEP